MGARLCGWCSGASGTSASRRSNTSGVTRAGAANASPPCTTRWPTPTSSAPAIFPSSHLSNPSAAEFPAPNSTAAQTAFFAGAGGPLSTETFEGQALGDPGTLSIAGGANVTWTAPNFGDGFSGVSTTTFGNVYGYDVTNSGRGKWLGFPGGSATFTFGSGVNAFGMWLTGLQTVFTSALTVSFNDGTSQVFNLPVDVNGGAQFWGLHDDRTFASVSISNTSNDAWGVDDVSYGGGGGVPEPAAWALMIGGFGLAGAALRRRRAALA